MQNRHASHRRFASGTLIHKTLHLLRDGTLVPEFFPQSRIACPDVLIFPRRRGHAYALSVPRRGLPEHPTISLEPRQLRAVTTELSLRARRLVATRESADAQSIWMLGVAPGLFDRPAFQNLTSFTLLGMLMPEFGVVTNPTAMRAYLGWSLPMEYRLVPAGQRQRPYDMVDRTAIELVPSVQVVLGPYAYHWIEGVSLGITGW